MTLNTVENHGLNTIKTNMSIGLLHLNRQGSPFLAETGNQALRVVNTMQNFHPESVTWDHHRGFVVGRGNQYPPSPYNRKFTIGPTIALDYTGRRQIDWTTYLMSLSLGSAFTNTDWGFDRLKFRYDPYAQYAPSITTEATQGENRNIRITELVLAAFIEFLTTLETKLDPLSPPPQFVPMGYHTRTN